MGKFIEDAHRYRSAQQEKFAKDRRRRRSKEVMTYERDACAVAQERLGSPNPEALCQSHPGSDQLRPSFDATRPSSKSGVSGSASWPSSTRACSLAPSCIALLTTEDLR